MKRYLLFFLAVCMLFTVVGCSRSDDQTTAPGTTASGITPTESQSPTDGPSEAETTAPSIPDVQRPLDAVFVPIHRENTMSEDGTVIFSHSYQDMSLITQDPDVAQKIIVDFLNRMDKSSRTAESLSQKAKENYHPGEQWNPYICHHTMGPTRIDSGVLSLFGNYAEYTGGVHANRSNVSVSYDLTTGDVLTLAGIMKVGAKEEAFADLTISALDSQKDKLYSDYRDLVIRRFNTDFSRDEKFFFTSEGLCFYFTPYEIAPYASGTILAEIPYEKLVGILDDAFFPAEVYMTKGTIQVTPFEQADLTQYSQIAEAVFQKEGTMLLIHSDDRIHNVRLCYSDDSASIEDREVFLANSIGLGDAIMVQAAQEQLNALTISYENSEGIQTKSLSDLIP